MFRLSKVCWASFFFLLTFASTAIAQSVPEVIATTPSGASTTDTAEPEPEPSLIREPPEPTREERLGEWLEALGAWEESSRFSRGVLNITEGGLLAAFGGVDFATSSSGEDPSQLEKGFGLFSLVIGGSLLGRGIYQVAVPGPAQKASEQYRTALSQGLDETEFRRFEGMLASASHEAQRKRRRQRWRGLGWLLGGGLILALTPVADLSSGSGDRGFAYATGAVTAFLGTCSFGLSFAGSPNHWQRYLDGEALGTTKKATARATPSVGRSYAGLSVSGTF